MNSTLFLAEIGIAGGCLCAIADLFLDLKGSDNKKIGKLKVIDSKWEVMPHYRFVVDKGSVVMEGAPRDILTQAERLEELRLTVPETVKIANELRSRGVNLRESIIFEDELIDELLKICR